ncbi:MAG: hypothetical protein AAB956_01295 [Patescibacteria group bacterium]
MIQSINNNEGSALLITILILASMLTVAFGVNELVVRGLMISRTSSLSGPAYLATESGAEKILWLVRKGAVDPYAAFADCRSGGYVQLDVSPPVCYGSSPYDQPYWHNLGGNDLTYSVKYTYNEAVNQDNFVIVGRYGEARRSISISYERSD